MLFPIFSLLFHLALILLIGAQAMHTPPEIKDEEIIAMIDLSEMPPQIKPPEPSPPIEPPVVLTETNPKSATGDRSENKNTEPEAILDPRLDEVLDDEPEGALPAAIETAQNIVIPQPSPAEESSLSDTAMPEENSAPEPISEAELPVVEAASEAVPEPELEAEPSSPEPVSEEPTSTAPEPSPAVPLTPDPPSAQEVAKASEVQDSPKAVQKKEVVAAIKKPVPPAPPPKPSKERVKKSGLLGLLGKEKRKPSAKNPLFAKALKRPRSDRLQVSAPNTNAAPTESLKKMARLKNKLLKSEQKRLMTKRSVGRKKKSQLKIVQGSGRNFGVISSAIAQEEWRLTNVYNRLLQKSPGLQGNLIIEFTISPEGKVIKSHVLTSSFANAHFEKALIRAIRLWKFPVAKEGATTILYPLAFSPAG